MSGNDKGGGGSEGRPSALRGSGSSGGNAASVRATKPLAVAFEDEAPGAGRPSGAFGPRHERTSGVHHARRGSRYSHYRYQPLALKPVEEVDGRSSPGADGGPSVAVGEGGGGGGRDAVTGPTEAGASGTTPGGGAGSQQPSASAIGGGGHSDMVDSTFGRQTAVRPPPETTTPSASPSRASSATKGKGKRPPPPTSLTKEGGGRRGEEAEEERGKKEGGGKKSSDKSPGLSDDRRSGNLEEIVLEERSVLEEESGIKESGGQEVGEGCSGEASEAAGGKVVEGGGVKDGETRRNIGSRSKSIGEQHWTNVRAVVALYSRLRKIKRTKSNQRWMKLRTTVQLSGAISSTIQKKTPLKREDSFLKRFSTRQIPETQETMDTGDDGDDGGSSSAGGGGGGGGGNGGGGGGCGGGGGGSSSHHTSDERRRRRRRAGYHRRRQVSPRSVINPDENFYFYWLFVLTACVLYNLWTLIVRQSFPELQAGIPVFWRCGDAFGDAVFLLDVAVQFRTGYLEQGLMVYDSKKLAAHYMASKAFLLDLFALAPLDLVQLSPKVGPNPLLRFPRFLKMYRLVDYYYMVESRTVYPNLWRVVNLVHILLILAHWFGCFYYLLSEAEGFQGDWVYPHRLEGDYATLTRKYLGSLYWSTLTLTTIGDLPTPETNAEYVFTIVSYLIGVFIFATIVGQVGNVITNRNANRLEFERLLDGAKTYMRHHKVPGDMKRRVLRWYDYSWSRGRIQGGGDINTALGLLPDKLKTELALHVNLSVLKKVTIFQECQPEFLHDLVLKMKAYIFTPGDLICRKGEVAREMFIIADGILEVISETGRVLTTMKAGDFFGEIGILNLDGLNKRTADVRSVGYSELFSLSREDVLAAMKDYPEAQEILQALGRKRLMEARNSGGRGASRKAVSRSSTKAASTPSPASTKSSPPALGKGHSKDEAEYKKEQTPGIQWQASTSSSSPALLAGTPGEVSVDGEGTTTGKRIVERLKSDVMGLREVLRKSKRIATRGMGDEAIELQPLTKETPSTSSMTTGSSQDKSPQLKALLLRTLTSKNTANWDSSCSGIKGALRRMSHVKSDDSGGDTGGNKSSPPEVRRASKRKRSRSKGDQGSEDADEREDDEEGGRRKSTDEPEQKHEIIGEGLPLITRLRMLREKEERERKMRERRRSSTKEESETEKQDKDSQKQKGDEQEAPSKPVEVIGEGLPLFTRLRMLREKEEREAAAAKKAEAERKAESENKATSAENGSKKSVAGSSTSHSSAPSTSEAEDKSLPAKTEQKPVVGAGRHLIQRLLLNKAREEREKEEKEKNKPISMHSKSTSPPSCSTRDSSTTTVSLERKESTPVATTATATTQISVAVVPPRTRDMNQSEMEVKKDVSCADGRCSDHSVSECGDAAMQETCSRTNTAQVTSAHTSTEDSVSISQDAGAHSTCASEALPCVVLQLEDEEEGEVVGEVSEGPDRELCSAATDRRQEFRSSKPHLLRLRRDKNYTSIDDLSPEYSGLPFIKKLKILNDRQRLAELDKSSSLDSGDCVERIDPSHRNLSRSFSDASYISQIGPPTPSHSRSDFPPRDSVAKTDASDCDDDDVSSRRTDNEDWRNLSPESNETLERQNLKSILKKLSGSIGGDEEMTKKGGGSLKSEEKINTLGATKKDLHQLMRAPTVEGYVARHSKLTKSVTFNRDTLASPPRTPTATSVSPSTPVLYTPEATTMAAQERIQAAQDPFTLQQPSISTTRPTPMSLSQDKRHFLLQSSTDFHSLKEDECFGGVLLGIKQVIQSHVEEIQSKFQEKFLSLESEVKKRDEIIFLLEKRISELEQPNIQTSTNGNTIEVDDESSTSSDGVNPFMRGDSADTVVTADFEEDLDADDTFDNNSFDHDSIAERQHGKKPCKRKSSHSFTDEISPRDEDEVRSTALSLWLSDRDGDFKMSLSSESSSSSFTSSSSPSPSSSSQEENDDMQMAGRSKDWEVQMLARELEKRQGVKRLKDYDEQSDKPERLGDDDEELESQHRLARRFLRLSRSERDLLERLLGSEEDAEEDEDVEDKLGDDPLLYQSRSLKQSRKKARKSESRRKSSSSSRKKNGTKSKDSKSMAQDSYQESDALGDSKKRKVWIGQQVLNARSLEESGSANNNIPSSSSTPSRRRAASTGQLPFLLPLPSLSALSNSFRGIAKAATAGIGQMSSQNPEPDPEKAVVTISGSGQSSSDCPIDTAVVSTPSPVPKL